MMQQQMKELEIDTEKMPLGKLSKDQIKKGEKVLEEIEAELEKAEAENRKPKQAFLVDATNRFYSHIPHYFPGAFFALKREKLKCQQFILISGGQRPTIIDNKELLQKKYDLLSVRCRCCNILFVYYASSNAFFVCNRFWEISKLHAA